MNPAIELFRGIAALMVLTAHYEFYSAAQMSFLHYLGTGVDLFFVISGFVFGETIYKKRHVPIMPYLSRRFFRIYPLYFVSLVFYYIFSRQDPDKLIYFLNHLLFLQTIFSPQKISLFNAAYWSLPIEIEFYILVPILAALYLRYKRLIPILLVLGVILNIFLIYKAAPAQDINAYVILLFHIPGTLTEFVIGILLFKLSAAQKDRHLSLSQYIGIFIFGLILFSLLAMFLLKTGYRDTNILQLRIKNLFFYATCATGYAFLLFPFLHGIRNNNSPFAVFCIFAGTTSYGVYLFHNLIIQLVLKRMVFPSFTKFTVYIVCLAATIAVAVILHYLIEAPFRTLGRNISRTLETRRAP